MQPSDPGYAGCPGFRPQTEMGKKAQAPFLHLPRVMIQYKLLIAQGPENYIRVSLRRAQAARLFRLGAKVLVSTRDTRTLSIPGSQDLLLAQYSHKGET